MSARRYPDKPFLVFYDTAVTFAEMLDEAERVAGFLEQRCGVRKGDRVLLLMQNSPQFVIGYYGILRANAVVVPINPMNLTREILRYAEDSGAATAIVSQELYPRVEPLIGACGLQSVIVAAYSDYLKRPTSLAVPDFVAAPRVKIDKPQVTLWCDVLASGLQPGPLTAGPDDLCVMPYTSGTTGEPKGCMHTHRSTMHTLVAGMRWFTMQPETTLMAVAPLFHVTGAAKLELAREHGADQGVQYPIGPLDKIQARALSERFKAACGADGAHVIYDGVGGDYTEAALRAIGWQGRHLVVGFTAGIPKLPLNLPLLKSCQIVGVFWGEFTTRCPAAHAANVAALMALYLDGRIKPAVTERFPLARGAEAIARLGAREARGKVVVMID